MRFDAADFLLAGAGSTQVAATEELPWGGSKAGRPFSALLIRSW